MMIQSINALTNAPSTTTVKAPQPQKPSFEGMGVNKAGKTMKALAAAAILGMAAVGMSSCVQPTDPTIIEEPTEKEETTPVEEDETITDDEETTPVEDEETKPIGGEEETKPVVDDDDTKPTTGDEETKPVVGDDDTKPTTGDEETKPIVDEETKPIVDDEEITNPEETKPIEETPFIVNDTISPALADTAVYKLLREVGFTDITGEEVPVEAGKYQPKTGEMTELSYTRKGIDVINYKLNRELSTDGHLVYDCTSYDPVYVMELGVYEWTGDEFSFDTENKIFTHYMPDEDGDHDYYEYRYIKVKEDGSLVQGKYKMDPESEDPAKRVPHDYAKEVPSWFESNRIPVWFDPAKNDASETYGNTIGERNVIDWTNIEFKLAK